MYNYGANIGILDGVSSIYLLSTATVFLAVVIALYCANLLKDDDSERGAGKVKEQQLENNCMQDSENIDHDCLVSNNLNRQEEMECSTEPVNGCVEDDESGSELHCEGLVSRLKAARLRELESSLTEQQLEEERRIEREQLSAIFELLKKQETEFNTQELDENELKAQLNLYR